MLCTLACTLTAVLTLSTEILVSGHTGWLGSSHWPPLAAVSVISWSVMVYFCTQEWFSARVHKSWAFWKGADCLCHLFFRDGDVLWRLFHWRDGRVRVWGECFLLRASGVACFTEGSIFSELANLTDPLKSPSSRFIETRAANRASRLSLRRCFPVAGLAVHDGSASISCLSTAEASDCASYFYFTRILTMVACCDCLINLKLLQVATDLLGHRNHCVQLQHWICCTFHKGFLLTYVAAEELYVYV